MPFRFSFRRWVPLAAALLLAALGIALGNWQAGRAHQKETLAQVMAERAREAPLSIDFARGALDLDALEFRSVSVRGDFVRDWTIYLENRPYQGQPGFYVLTPLRVVGTSEHVLVLRGWGPRDGADRTRRPDFSTPAGEVTVTGLVRRDPGRVLQLGRASDPEPGVVLQNLDQAELARASGLALLPFVLQQTDAAAGAHADGLVRDWPAPSLGVDKHRGYAFQWYALAAAALIFFIVTGFRRAK